MIERIKAIFYLSIIVLIISLIFNYLDKKQKLYNENFLNDLNYNFDYIHLTDNKSSITKSNFDIKDVINKSYSNIIYNKNTLTNNVKKVMNEVKGEKSKSPTVYIYTTHQKEEYSYKKNSLYDFVPTVMTTSYMLQERFKKNNIVSIVEESDLSKVLKKNKWKYSYSYKVSRSFLEAAAVKYPTLTYFIDVHRDSVNKDITTIEIGKKKYARVLFILGLENKNHSENAKMIEALNSKINSKYPGLSRGIYKKKGKGVNGVYNQDFSKNCILIEFGGHKNTIEEVYNTVSIVGDIISEYIGDSIESWKNI